MVQIAPVTSATVEHSSSSWCFRSTMREDRLNTLLLLFVHKDIALDYDAIIDDYAKRNQRRMTFINPLQWIFLWLFKPLQWLFLWLFLKSCPWDTFRLFKFFDKSSYNLCPQPTFLVADDQCSQNACSKYRSQRNYNVDLSIFQGENVAAFAGRLCSRCNCYAPLLAS